MKVLSARDRWFLQERTSVITRAVGLNPPCYRSFLLYLAAISTVCGCQVALGSEPILFTWQQPTLWRELPSRTPLVQLELLTRDRLTGELLRLDEQTTELRIAHGVRLQFPTSSLLGLQQLTAWDVIDFRGAARSASAEHWPTAPAAGRWSGWLSLSAQSDTAQLVRWQLGNWFCQLTPHTVQWETAGRVRELPWSFSILPGQSLRFELTWQPGRVQLVGNGHLLFDEPRPLSDELETVGLNVTPGPAVHLTSMTVSRPAQVVYPPGRPLVHPILGLSDGQELTADKIKLQDGELALLVDQVSLNLPWSAWKSLTWPIAAAPRPGREVSGWLVELELQPLRESPGEPPDRLCGALVAMDALGCRLAHGQLGEIPLSWSAICQLRLRGWGTATPLRAGPVHLGDEVRMDLRSPTPAGTRLAGAFIAPRSLFGSAWLEFAQSDLEPAGADTPRASPFLAELRSGQLATRLALNGRDLGPLNRHMTWKARPEQPQQVLVPLPPGLLRHRNHWKLTQSPATPSGGYDDWELWNPTVIQIWLGIGSSE